MEKHEITRVEELGGETRSLATDAAATFVLTAAGGAGTTVGIAAAKEAIKSVTGKKHPEK